MARPYLICKYTGCENCNARHNNRCYALFEFCEDKDGNCKFYKSKEDFINEVTEIAHKLGYSLSEYKQIYNLKF